ncbi:DUF2793 domain-containing protein [Microbacteriaceae bacterium K1510]|nr:DUF2793 domain-containing protein [Microbacteriaceae bacterium K1510]
MTDTSNLGLPCIEGSQAQKHVTHNDALRLLDTLVQLAVIDRDLTAPPSAPTEGERYIVSAGATGPWTGHDDAIAAWQDGGWQFSMPRTGWLSYVIDESVLVVWNGSAWVDVFAAICTLQNLTRLGVGTTADSTNPLSAKLNNALFAARTGAEGGDGNLRYKLSKESAAKTLSLLFQDNWSGRAEIGLTGDDDLHVKVSPDGSQWIEALVAERASGLIKVQGLTHAASNARAASMVFTPGGDGTVSIWRVDASSGQNPRMAAIAGIASDTITLTTPVANTFFFDTYMAGVSYIRIWNTSKALAQSAWVKAQPAVDALQVLNADDLAGWSAGEIVQVGDPTDVTPNRVMALDISPMMQNLFGAVFRQSGIMVKGGITSATALDSIGVSATGASGSFVTAAQAFVVNGFNASVGVAVIPCSQLSPVSNSNLVFVREIITSTAANRLVSAMAVYV